MEYRDQLIELIKPKYSKFLTTELELLDGISALMSNTPECVLDQPQLPTATNFDTGFLSQLILLEKEGRTELLFHELPQKCGAKLTNHKHLTMIRKSIQKMEGARLEVMRSWNDQQIIVIFKIYFVLVE